ncbi:SSI family serine proteinase inhibitor [Actinomadura atramentaria]|uniref:SSI family serine proteinase inhibitor n=1 Tax=Actinomadura atramentaria TaxID=1990 RepID=UPI000360B3C3|nr:SSI family serine proteinase inhibitor [Actinomadura atramentaria]
MPRLVHAALTGAALALLPAVPAAAGPAPGAEIRLAVRRVGGPVIRSVVLRCDPPGGTHPRAADACADLAERGGRPENAVSRGFCTMLFAPVVAEAAGRYRGLDVRFRKEYANACVMRSRTGTLFAF